MGLKDQEKIKIAREYFVRADQGRPDILELFHEDAEIYFPKFGFGVGRHRFSKWLKDSKGPWSIFGTAMTIRLSFLQATIWWLKELHTVKCLKKGWRQTLRRTFLQLV